MITLTELIMKDKLLTSVVLLAFCCQAKMVYAYTTETQRLTKQEISTIARAEILKNVIDSDNPSLQKELAE